MIIVMFKSDEKYFNVEKSGAKSNTFRVRPKISTEEDDDRFKTLKRWSENPKEQLWIRIVCTNPDEGWFSRKVTNVSIGFIEEREVFIISWDHWFD